MTKMSIAGALAAAATIAAFSCQEWLARPRSRSGCPPLGAPRTTCTSPVRGYVRAQWRPRRGLSQQAPPRWAGSSGTPFNQARGARKAPSLSLLRPGATVRDDGEEAVVYVAPDRHVHRDQAGRWRRPTGGARGQLPQPRLQHQSHQRAARGAGPDERPSAGRHPVPTRGWPDRPDLQVGFQSRHRASPPTGGAGGIGWHRPDPRFNATVTANAGSPSQYARTDNWSTVVYIGSDQHIHEIASTLGGTWSDWDLSAAASDLVAPASDPWGIKRSDQYNCVQYIGADNLMHQLALFPGSTWNKWFDPLPGRRPNRGTPREAVGVHQSQRRQRHHLSEQPPTAARDDTRTRRLVRCRVAGTGGRHPKGQTFGHSGGTGRNSITFRGLANGLAHGYDLNQPNGGPWTVDPSSEAYGAPGRSAFR